MNERKRKLARDIGGISESRFCLIPPESFEIRKNEITPFPLRKSCKFHSKLQKKTFFSPNHKHKIRLFPGFSRDLGFWRVYFLGRELTPFSGDEINFWPIHPIHSFHSDRIERRESGEKNNGKIGRQKDKQTDEGSESERK